MTSILSTLKTTGAAAIVALALSAAPALAQSGEPSFSFNLGIGNGSQMQMDAPQGGNFRHGGNDGGFNDDGDFRHGGGNGGGFNACLSDRQVIRGLRDYGFSRVEINDSSRRRAEVIARWGRSDYLIAVNKCSGEANIIKRLRRGGNGFGLQFGFNN